MQKTPPKKAVKRKRKSNRALFVFIAVAALMAASFALGYKFGADSKRFKGTVLLVNAEHTLSPDYVPEDLVNLYTMRHSFRLASSEIYLTREAYEPMQQMFAAAEAEDMNGYIITSGYRSYERQKEVYEQSESGYAQKPGASEHQTGLCFDVTVETANGFENTPQYAWLRANAHKYGFIQRYPSNKASITGISYEPWHYRYVGVKIATEIYENNLTLEEYLK